MVGIESGPIPLPHGRGSAMHDEHNYEASSDAGRCTVNSLTASNSLHAPREVSRVWYKHGSRKCSCNSIVFYRIGEE